MPDPLLKSARAASTLGLVAILLTVLCWALAANVAFDLFRAGTQPLELAAASAIIATFGLAILNSFWGQSHTKPMRLKQLGLGLVLVLLVGADYMAIQQLPVAVAIVLLFTAPILVILWTAFVSGQAPSRSVGLALMLSIVGVVLVSKLLESSWDQVNWFGIGIGLTTAVCFAAYIILSEQIVGTAEPVGILLQTYAVASLVWLAYQLTQGIPTAVLMPEHVPKVLVVGLAGNLLPYLLFLWSVQRVRAERAAIVATLEPLVAAIVAWLWFGQTLTLLQILGGGLIVAAVTAIQFNPSSLASQKLP
ncbi:MAG TPA: EamA family transporter [Allocoleopsis sp.]